MNLTIIPVLGLWLLLQQDTSLLLERATPPSKIPGTIATGVSVVEVEMDGKTGSIQTRPLYGSSPFVAPGLNALMNWRFAVPQGASRARTSVTFLFRSPAIYAINIPRPMVRPYADSKTTSALPQEITDTGYPAGTDIEGVVIMAARINAEGGVIGVEKFSGQTALFNQAQAAVRAWKFSPARISGKPVSSTAYVVISFVRPT